MTPGDGPNLDALLAEASPDTQALETTPVVELLKTARHTLQHTSPEEAEAFFLAGARRANREGDNRILVSEFLDGLAQIEQWRGRWQRELTWRIALIDLIESRGHEGEIAKQCARIAALHIALEAPELARIATERALGYWRWHNDWRAEIGFLLDRGDAWRDTRANLREALACYDEAQRRAREAPTPYPPIQSPEPDPRGQRHRILLADLRIAQLYGRFGQEPLSLPHYRRARDAVEMWMNDADRLLTEIGEGLDAAGEAREAVASFDRAIAVAKRRAAERTDEPHVLEWRMRRADTLQARGSFHLRRGEAERAVPWLDQALTLYINPPASPRHIQALLDRGRLYLQENRLEKAGSAFNNAYRGAAGNVRPGVGFRPDLRIEAQLFLLEFHVRNHDDANRQKTLKQILQDVDTIPDLLARMHALVQVARPCERFGDHATALRLLRQAESLLDEALRGLPDPSEAPALLRGAVQNLFARQAALRLRAVQGWDAFASLDRGRGRGMALQAALIRAHNPHENAALRQARQEMADAGRWRQRTSGTTREAQATTQWQESWTRYRLLRDRLRARQSGPALDAPPPALSAAQLQARLARTPDTLVTTWARLDPESETWLILAASHRGVQAWTKPLPHLQRTLAAWRSALLAGLSGMRDERRQARECFSALLGPIEQAGLLRGYTRLVAIPEGALGGIPFAALVDANGQRLAERVAVSVALSLALRDGPRARTAPGGLLVVRPEAPLPYGAHEAAGLAALFPQTRLLVGPGARETRVKTAMAQHDLLHFIAHGRGDEATGLRSWLALSPEPPGSPEDGRLEAWEMAQLRLSARLATLSACESGQGMPAPGEGLLGIAWALQAAGCAATVTSLWTVEDESASALMERFYHGLAHGLPKDVALQKAMLALRAQGRWRHPRHWAAFQLVGDAAPLANLRPGT